MNPSRCHILTHQNAPPCTLCTQTGIDLLSSLAISCNKWTLPISLGMRMLTSIVARFAESRPMSCYTQQQHATPLTHFTIIIINIFDTVINQKRTFGTRKIINPKGSRSRHFGRCHRGLAAASVTSTASFDGRKREK